MAERKKLTVTAVQAIKKGTGTYGEWQSLPFMAKDEMGTDLLYAIFNKKALFDLVKVGAVIDAEFEVKTRESHGNTYVDRTVTQIYQDSKPVLEVKTGGYVPRGKSPAEIELSRRSYALSYAKDLAMSDRISVAEILPFATRFDSWLQGEAVTEPEPPLVKEAKKIGAKESLATKEQVDKLKEFVGIKLVNLAPIIQKCGYPVKELAKYTESEAANIILNAEIALAEKK